MSVARAYAIDGVWKSWSVLCDDEIRCHMLTLPDEVVVVVLFHLEMKDILTMRRVCKRFARVGETQSLWMDYHRKDPGLLVRTINSYYDDAGAFLINTGALRIAPREAVTISSLLSRAIALRLEVSSLALLAETPDASLLGAHTELALEAGLPSVAIQLLKRGHRPHDPSSAYLRGARVPGNETALGTLREVCPDIAASSAIVSNAILSHMYELALSELLEVERYKSDCLDRDMLVEGTPLIACLLEMTAEDNEDSILGKIFARVAPTCLDKDGVFPGLVRRSALHVAASRNLVACVGTLLDLSADPEALDGYCHTPYMSAVYDNSPLVAELCDQRGLRLPDGMTPPMFIVSRGFGIETFTDFLGRWDVERTDDFGHTVMHYVCERGSFAFLEVISKAAAESSFHDIASDSRAALEGGHLEAFKRLGNASTHERIVNKPYHDSDRRVRVETETQIYSAMRAATMGGHGSIVEAIGFALKDPMGEASLAEAARSCLAAAQRAPLSFCVEQLQGNPELWLNARGEGGDSILHHAARRMATFSTEYVPKLHRKLHHEPLDEAPSCAEASSRANLIVYVANYPHTHVVNSVNDRGESALVLLCRDSSKADVDAIAAVRALVSAMAWDALWSAPVECGRSPLHYALARECKDISTCLLEALGSNNATKATQVIVHRDVGGRTPLHHALEHGDGAATVAMLEAAKGCLLPSALNHVPSVLAAGCTYFADMEGTLKSKDLEYHEDVLLRVLAATPPGDINCAHVNTGRIPIGAACQAGMSRVVLSLIRAGADPCAVDLRGDTPLLLACCKEKPHEGVINILLAHGAGPSVAVAARHTGRTPLHYCCAAGSLALTRLLIAAGAPLNVSDFDFKTPLHLCMRDAHYDVTSFLLDQGASVEATDNRRRTAAHIACLMRNPSVRSGRSAHEVMQESLLERFGQLCDNCSEDERGAAFCWCSVCNTALCYTCNALLHRRGKTREHPLSHIDASMSFNVPRDAFGCSPQKYLPPPSDTPPDPSLPTPLLPPNEKTRVQSRVKTRVARVPQWDDVMALVVDPGADMTCAGFSGDDAPRAVFPSIVGTFKYKGIMTGAHFRTFLVGDACNSHRGIAVAGSVFTPGLNGGLNWDNVERLYHHSLYNELKVAPEEHPICLSSPLHASTEYSDKQIQILFETFNAPAMWSCSQNMLSMLSTGVCSGMTVVCGHSATEIAAFHEGYQLPGSTQTLRIGGHNVDSMLEMSLMKMGVDIRRKGENLLLREIKEKTCFVRLGCDAPPPKNATFGLPDGTTILVEDEARTLPPEVLFRPGLLGLDSVGLHTAIANSYLDCSELIPKITLVGGCVFKNQVERLKKEMVSRHPEWNRLRIDNPLGSRYMVWVGGSVLSSLSGAPWFTKEEYDENGPYHAPWRGRTEGMSLPGSN